MRARMNTPDLSLVGIGLYTPAEAGRLIGVGSGRLIRWLRGHTTDGRHYDRLWTSQIALDPDETYLGFLVLMQARVAATLIRVGLNAQKVRRAIVLAQEIVAGEHPFATARFRTDGRTLILQVLRESQDDDQLIDLFQGGQYAMREVVEPSLEGVEFDGDIAARWWPAGRSGGIVLDPRRQFGRPIEAATGVPTAILANAAIAEGSVKAAATAYLVPPAAVRRAVEYEQSLAA